MSELPPLLVLGRETLAGLMTAGDHLEAAEMAFRLLAEGSAELPPPQHMAGLGGDFHVKSAVLPLGRRYAAVKVNGNFPSNPESHGLPTIQGAILLFDASRGSPLALLDSIEITAARTAAASALAARYLARTNSSSITICGCGEQARSQLAAIADLLPIDRAFTWDADRGRAKDFAERMWKSLGIRVAACEALEEATLASDVIVTCTTSTSAFLDQHSVRPGTFIAAVGADSPSKQEIAPTLLARARVFADVRDQACSMGDSHHAIEAGAMTADGIAGEMADLVCGRARSRTDDEEITIFDSTGTAVQDVAAAAKAYEKAVQANVGTWLQMS